MSMTFALKVQAKYCLIPALFFLLCGCSGSNFQLSSVSGTVKLDGKPLANADVVFAPIGEGENINPGPASVGVTDSQGHYTLSVHSSGKDGAVVGNHRIGITLKTLGEAEIQAHLNEEIAKADRKGTALNKSQLAKISTKFVRSSNKRPQLPEKYNIKTELTFKVEKGENAANFDLESE